MIIIAGSSVAIINSKEGGAEQVFWVCQGELGKFVGGACVRTVLSMFLAYLFNTDDDKEKLDLDL